MAERYSIPKWELNKPRSAYQQRRQNVASAVSYLPVRRSTIFQRPIVPSIRVAMAMCGEESRSMLPEPGPDLLAVRLRQFKSVQSGAREEMKSALGVYGRKDLHLWFHFEQKHEPMRVSLVTVFADEAGEMQVAGLKLQPGFFEGFTTGAGVGGFAFIRMQFPAAGAPAAAIGFLGAFEQEDFILIIKAIEQGGDLVGQLHGVSESGGSESRKKLKVVGG